MSRFDPGGNELDDEFAVLDATVRALDGEAVSALVDRLNIAERLNQVRDDAVRRSAIEGLAALSRVVALVDRTAVAEVQRQILERRFGKIEGDGEERGPSTE